MKKILALWMTALLLVSMLSGCNQQSEEAYVPTGDALVMEGEEPTTDESGEEEVQELTLTYYKDRSMNPLLSTDFTNRALFSLMYQGLFTVDRDYQTEPMLCKRYAVSEDMMTYTFYIDQATFSDGSRLTTQDVIASLEAAQESNYYKGRFQHITEIMPSGDGGVTITLDTPCENLPILLDIPILKTSQVDLEFPLGTGPYYLDVAGSRLVRRSNWWCEAEEMTVTAPVIDLLPAGTPNEIRDDFQFAQLDLVCADPGSDHYADYRSDYELWDCESGIFMYIGMSPQSEVFSVPEIRAALTYAINRDYIVDTYYRGFARSACLPASPTSPYYSQSLASRYEYDAAKFSQAIANAGKFGTKIEFLVNSDDSLRLKVAKDIAQTLRECGLDVEMKAVGGQLYRDCIWYYTYDIYLGQTKLSPNMDLSPFFSYTGELSIGGMNNVAAAALCNDALANHGNYYTLHKTVMDEGLLCPVLFRSYAIYGTRGLLTTLTPSRDTVFYYSIGKNMTECLIQ